MDNAHNTDKTMARHEVNHEAGTSALYNRDEGSNLKESNERKSRSRTLSRFRDHLLERHPLSIELVGLRQPLTRRMLEDDVLNHRSGTSYDRSPLTTEKLDNEHRKPLTKAFLQDRTPLANRHKILLDKSLYFKDDQFTRSPLSSRNLKWDSTGGRAVDNAGKAFSVQSTR